MPTHHQEPVAASVRTQPGTCLGFSIPSAVLTAIVFCGVIVVDPLGPALSVMVTVAFSTVEPDYGGVKVRGNAQLLPGAMFRLQCKVPPVASLK